MRTLLVIGLMALGTAVLAQGASEIARESAMEIASERATERTPDRAAEGPKPDFARAPKLAWIFRARQPFFGSPRINGARVFAGNNDSTCYAIDLATGQAVWTFRSGGAMRGGICIDASRLFVVGGDSSMYCLDKQNGKVIWRFRTGGERMYDQYDYYQSTPVVRGDTLYFGSGDGNIYALDARSGSLIWRFGTGGVVHGGPVLEGGRIFAGSFDGYVYALNSRDGSLVWKFKSVGQRFFPKGEMQFSPVVAGGIVLIGGRDFNLYAIDAEKGYCRWNKQFPRGWAPVITRTHSDSSVLVGTSDDKVLLSLRCEDGKELWRADVRFNVFGASALTDSMCYTATLMGKLYGIDLRSGRIGWSISTDSYRRNGSKYLRTDDSYRDDIYSIIHSQEEYLAALNDMGAIYSTPAVDGQHIVFSSTEGTIYCWVRTASVI